ncbi:MAG TPA: hypothetical protein VEF03_12820 [Candidatus Binataceae bacterium]|nr:hypothetical protein [Candidatus Binataceae bacterium]
MPYAIRLKRLPLICALIAFGATTPFAADIERTAATVAPPAAMSASFPAGFAPDGLTLFAPALEVVSPGPNRAKRALAVLDRQFAVQPLISFHPAYSDDLNALLEVLPARDSTLIRALSYYNDEAVPWRRLSDGSHAVFVKGSPRTNDFFYATSQRFIVPETPWHFAGEFVLKPTRGSSDADAPRSVIGTLGGELQTDTFGLGAMVDAAAAILRQTYGDLKPPWDTAPGQVNHHDKAAMDRFEQNFPNFNQHIKKYLTIENVLDEFDSPEGPYVLYNLRGSINPEALRPFPHLSRFYDRIIPYVTADSTIVDEHGNTWMRTEMKSGRIAIIFMIRRGMLTPFNDRFEPAGSPIEIESLESGRYFTRASARIHRMGTDFGLTNIDFVTNYRRTRDAVSFDSRMNSVPELIAPPGVHQAADFIAGEFLATVARGNEGFHSSFESHENAGIVDIKGAFTGEFMYSPALEFLARIGDAIADANNANVRIEERKIGEELFDAFLKDYNDARPKILALDGESRNPK